MGKDIGLCLGLCHDPFCGRNADTGVKTDDKQNDDQDNGENGDRDPELPGDISGIQILADLLFDPGRFFRKQREHFITFIEKRKTGDGTQFIGKDAHGRIAVFRAFCQCFLQDRVHPVRYAGDGFRGGRDRAAGMLHHYREGGMAGEKFVPGDHFIIDDRERIFIGASVNGPAERYFRCGVIAGILRIVIGGER